ncbi:MAG TPA: hypothetical protein PLY09_04210 [Methanothrix sp.]|nr:hypothetical protein [Methanothrix sp.]
MKEDPVYELIPEISEFTKNSTSLKNSEVKIVEGEVDSDGREKPDRLERRRWGLSIVGRDE